MSGRDGLAVGTALALLLALTAPWWAPTGCRLGLGGAGTAPTLSELTARRRSEGRPDPARVRVLGPRVLRPTFPELPVLQVLVEHTDSEPFRITWDGGRPGLLHTDLRLEPEDPGAAWGTLERPFFQKWTPRQESIVVTPGTVLGSSRRDDPPGTSPRHPLGISMHGFAEEAAPSPVRFRVLYAGRRFFGEGPMRPEDVPVSSEELELRWQTLWVAVGAEERAKWLADLDRVIELPVVRLDRVARNGARERLLAAGPRLLPVLLDELLEERRTSRHRRAWLLALLFDISGLLDPRVDRGTAKGPLGAYHDGDSRHDGGPAEGAQRDLAERWRALTPLVQERAPR